ncbi:hypothetical protein Sme01_31560 [Sphaerisporangium melleum]|uniref:Uncharacterized protein n=1 Tax=Sphaerisporangium melleum TaxID=321316 RepID=A0A917VL30_9ACTN|nr:hypothetical protein [Sphaerisporangium melleum]GGK96120.1 hypothetical protein GCM10007964_42980 [Sphaerisporangium melleum]GII70680.1 hypothetical protein Sme01_31560 [Sphaerisporangium melleum]
MPLPWHDALRNLITSDPAITLALLRAAAVKVPDGLPLAAGPYSVSDRVSTDLYPDNTVRVGPAHDRACTVIVEIERELSAGKLEQFAIKAAAVALETRKDVQVLVFTRALDAGVWDEPVNVRRGALSYVLTPVIYGRRDLPRLTDPKQIAADPASGVLSVFGHGDDPKVAEAFASATDFFPVEPGVPYTEWAYDCGPALFRSMLEAKMEVTDWPVSTPFAKRHYGRGLAEGEAKGKAEGEAKGKAKGKAEGEANAVLTVLATRGVPVTDRQAAAILACTDLEQLEKWLTKAVTATTIDDLGIE